MRFTILVALATIVSHLGFAQNMNDSPKKYLALGDSYTIGEAVPEADRWPVQLVERLRKDDITIKDPSIVATTGWTTDELQNALQRVRLDGSFDLVSLLIGVNNQYRAYPIETYRKEFEELLDQAIALADGDPDRVFVVSIPDYGVTAFAKNKNLDAAKIGKELDAYNAIAQEICASQEVTFFDITKWSRKAAKKPELIAEDGLHPSGIMYKNWVDTCYKWVCQTLKDQ